MRKTKNSDLNWCLTAEKTAIVAIGGETAAGCSTEFKCSSVLVASLSLVSDLA